MKSKHMNTGDYDESLQNWDNLERQIQNFGNKLPFDHVVVDDFFTKPTVDALVSEFPNFESKEHGGFPFCD